MQHMQQNLQGKKAKKPKLSGDKVRNRRIKQLENKNTQQLVHSLQSVLGFPTH